MAASKKDLVNKLADLQETNVDLQKTYEKAADNVTNSELKSTFQNYAQQYSKYATELNQEIRNLGETPEKKGEGSVVGTLHRGFMDIRSAFSRDDEKATVAEIIRAEDMAIGNYEDALKADWPSEVQTKVSTQFGELKKHRERLDQFKRSM